MLWCCCGTGETCGQIVFTAASGTITVPSTGAGNGTVNGGIAISTTGGSGAFAGATGWTSANGIADVQPFSWRILAGAAGVNVGDSRPVDLRFNQFTLAGTCAACGVLITPTSNGYLLGNVFPVVGVALNTGVSNGATIRAGSLYGEAAITFDFTGIGTGNLSFEAVSNGAYTITLELCEDEAPPP